MILKYTLYLSLICCGHIISYGFNCQLLIILEVASLNLELYEKI